MGLNRSPLVNVLSTKDFASVAGGARARCAPSQERANLHHSRARVQAVFVAGNSEACKSSPFSYTFKVSALLERDGR